MYKIIATLSVIIRTFYLPNPFTSLEGKLFLPCGIVDIPIPTNAFNILFGIFVLAPISFEVTGLYYEKGYEDPAKGSFLFLFFYSIHTGLVYLMGLFNFAYWAVALILIVYALAHIGFNALKNRVRYGV